MTKYHTEPCWTNGYDKTVLVQPSFKPYSHYCDDCADERKERFAWLDKEPDVEEESEDDAI